MTGANKQDRAPEMAANMPKTPLSHARPGRE